MRTRGGTEHQALDEPAAEALQYREPDWSELRDIGEALAKLPVEQRTVVLLVGLEQFTYEEAAQVLEIPIGTVMSRLSRGRERMRMLLGGDFKAASLKVVK